MALHSDIQQHLETIRFQAQQMLPYFWEHPFSMAQWALREISGAYVLTPALGQALEGVDIALQEIANAPETQPALMDELRTKLADLESVLSTSQFEESWAFIRGA